MVKRRDGAGARPFAFIFARMPLHDIVLQVRVAHARAAHCYISSLRHAACAMHSPFCLT
jgi:hypothetical protein